MISVILPTKNEEMAIGEIVERCRKIGVGEIIVIDNSSDRTPEIAEDLGCRVIRGVEGYGNAYLEGLKHVRGEIVVMMDADGSYDPMEIPKLIEPILKGEAEVVIGSRFKGKILPKAMRWHHKYIGNPLLTKLTNFLFKTNFSDVHCGFRAIKRDAITKLDLKCPGMEFATEFVIKAVTSGLKISEKPITYHPRRGGSKLRSFRDGWRHLRLILATSPGYVFLAPSIALCFLGLSLILFVVLFEPIRTHTLILGALLIQIGIQTFFFGISGMLYSKQIGFRKEDRLTSFFASYSEIEKIMFFGFVVFLLGILIGYKVVSEWLKVGFGSLSELNGAVLSMLLIFAGIQLILSALFLSIFLLNEKEK
ncbi:MAG: glycosyltransferase family 2 protein [Archaeoglobaceae archaeon]